MVLVACIAGEEDAEGRLRGCEVFEIPAGPEGGVRVVAGADAAVLGGGAPDFEGVGFGGGMGEVGGVPPVQFVDAVSRNAEVEEVLLVFERDEEADRVLIVLPNGEKGGLAHVVLMIVADADNVDRRQVFHLTGGRI